MTPKPNMTPKPPAAVAKALPTVASRMLAGWYPRRILPLPRGWMPPIDDADGEPWDSEEPYWMWWESSDDGRGGSGWTADDDENAALEWLRANPIDLPELVVTASSLDGVVYPTTAEVFQRRYPEA